MPKAHLSRRYHLSASHRLHAPALTEAENQATFGKCNNPHGHGHNYIVEITVSGPVSPVTGMVCNLAALDAFAHEHLLTRFDHENLNTLHPFNNQTDQLVPTTENLTLEVARIFHNFPDAHLENIHIEETPNNAFDLNP